MASLSEVHVSIGECPVTVTISGPLKAIKHLFGLMANDMDDDTESERCELLDEFAVDMTQKAVS